MKRMYLIVAVAIVVIATSCDSMSKQAVDNAVYERCIVEGTITVIDSTITNISIQNRYRIRRVSDNVIFNYTFIFSDVYHTGDTVVAKFDKRYDYETN